MQSVVGEELISMAAVRGRLRRRNGDFDGRSAAGVRVRRLITQFVKELGGPDAVSLTMMPKVRRAAELIVTAEELRASTLRGERPTDLAMLALVRLEGIADRAVRRLHIGAKRDPGLELRPSPPLASMERASR
jgi:hypothetical protein